MPYIKSLHKVTFPK